MVGALDDEAEAVVIGGMVLHINATPSIAANRGTTIPGKVCYALGGVARNIAVCMSKLGAKPYMIRAVGFDLFHGTGTQGGGQETTAWTTITQLTHHGMVYVPIGCTFGDGMWEIESIRGGSPYGAGVISGDGTREPSETEVALAQHQGSYMASIVKRFATPYSSTSIPK